MSNIVNLRQARKAKARADKAREADGNRARFGRTKAQRMVEAAAQARLEARVDGAFREGRDAAALGDGEGAD